MANQNAYKVVYGLLEELNQIQRRKIRAFQENNTVEIKSCIAMQKQWQKKINALDKETLLVLIQLTGPNSDIAGLIPLRYVLEKNPHLSDKEVVSEAALCDPQILEVCPEDVKNDKKFIKRTLSKTHGKLDCNCDDAEIAQEALNIFIYDDLCNEIPACFKSNKETQKNFVESFIKNPELYNHAMSIFKSKLANPNINDEVKKNILKKIEIMENLQKKHYPSELENE